MSTKRKAGPPGKAPAQKGEARNRANSPGLKIKKHKHANGSGPGQEGKSPRPRICVQLHTTLPEVILALTAIRSSVPGCTARIQELRLEQALRRWALTSFEMSKHLDLYDPRARVQGLRLRGLVVNRVWVLIETDCGQVHRVGRYSLQRGSEPQPRAPQSDLSAAEAGRAEGLA